MNNEIDDEYEKSLRYAREALLCACKDVENNIDNIINDFKKNIYCYGVSINIDFELDNLPKITIGTKCVSKELSEKYQFKG